MQRVDAADWHSAVDGALRAGYREFVTLMAIDDGSLQLWLRLRNGAGDDVVLVVAADAPVPTLMEVLPDADWFEREAADMFGVRFLGREVPALVRAPGTPPPMPKDVLLEARQHTPWPGEKDPGGTTPRRRTLPPGVVGGAR